MKLNFDFAKKLKPLDITILGIIVIALIVGGLTFLGKRVTSKSQIEASSQVEIEAFFRGVVVTSANTPFNKGDETFITIRNVPYTKLKIKSVNYERKKTIVPTMNPKQPFAVVEDVTSPFQFDFLVTVVDNAKITKDGAVVGGNKIKIGLPITYEGVDYKLNGVVTNITIVNEPVKETSSEITKQVQKNQDVQ